MQTPEQLYQKMTGFSKTYFLIDLHHDRADFYAIPKDKLNIGGGWLCLSGIVLNLIMDGELEKAWDYINMLPAETSIYAKFMKSGLTIVHPEVTWKEFIATLDEIKALGAALSQFILTAGRPFLLNGFNDFSRLGIFLPKNRERFIEYLSCMYEKKLCPYIYKLSLAEYYYQQNRLIDAQMLASTTIKEFDIDGERRIMFSTLYLRSKILLVSGCKVKSKSFIKDIRNLVKTTGCAEFSNNIDAAEVLFALYEGKMDVLNNWLISNAPDEYGDFNMLDLYRYMIKMRCYITTKNYAAVIALAEKLRPLLQKGRRFMDLCELDLLLAMSLYLSENKELAFEALKRALNLVHLHRYYRLVADEATVMLQVLIDYIKQNGETDFLMMLAEMTRETSIRLPLYLLDPKICDEHFTKMETDVLRLLEQGKTKEEIAEMFFISVNTVKFHIHNIYTKLGVEKPHQAIWQAKVRGLLPPTF